MAKNVLKFKFWRKPLDPRLRRAGMTAVGIAFIALAACRLRPTYPEKNLAESLQSLLAKDYKVSVETRHSGKSLQAHLWKIGLFKGELAELQGMSRESMQSLEHMLLCSTRVALSTDAKLDFIEIKLMDVFTGAYITLWRYVPDIRDSMLQRIGDTEYFSRLVIEVQAGESVLKGKEPPRMDVTTKWNSPLSMSEFLAKQVIMRAKREGGESIMAHADLSTPTTLGVVIENLPTLMEEDPDAREKISHLVNKSAQKVIKGYRFDGFREIVIRDARGVALHRGVF